MSKRQKSALAGVLTSLPVTLLIWAAIGHRTVSGQDIEDQPIKTPVRVSVQHGETVVSLDPATQARVGLSLATVEAFSTRQQLRSAATILPAEDLVNLRDAFVVANIKLEKARISVDVSRKEYDRLNLLYQDDQNTSLKNLETAQATLSSNQADADSAERELALQQSLAQQRWGKVVAAWVTSGSPNLQRLLDQRDFLVQVTLPPEDASAAPQSARLEIPNGWTISARLVSAFPRLDPRIQGASFLYVTNSHPGLAPGLNLAAHLPVGQVMKGMLVPQAAVVWWQGKAWVYVQTSPQVFVRREVHTDTPVENGWFVSTGFSPGDKIVVGGAQMLLSEEFRSQAATAAEK
jgi:hypothetical protein